MINRAVYAMLSGVLAWAAVAPTGIAGEYLILRVVNDSDNPVTFSVVSNERAAHCRVNVLAARDFHLEKNDNQRLLIVSDAGEDVSALFAEPTVIRLTKVFDPIHAPSGLVVVYFYGGKGEKYGIHLGAIGQGPFLPMKDERSTKSFPKYKDRILAGLRRAGDDFTLEPVATGL